MASHAVVVAAAVLSAAGAAAVPAAADGPRPCDILGAAGNPCVAAHSTVRALYAKYDGPLYNVTRASDGESALVGVLEAGGFADIATHEAHCPKLDCVISNVMDQSPQGNHLGPRHKLVNASRHKIMAGGKTVYGMYFDPGFGMHVDNTTGVATGNDPESMYAVMSGTHYNGECCFDYGNSERDDKDDGAGAMEAIYFGNAHWQGNSGNEDLINPATNQTGPWIGADLESGMYYGGGPRTGGHRAIVNKQSVPLQSDFVSLCLKGRSDGFMLAGGDATKGAMTTMWDGPRPFEPLPPRRPGNGLYQPMKKQGAIILATGGDASNSAEGSFYEGFMATGYASAASDTAVQANIVAVGYKTVTE